MYRSVLSYCHGLCDLLGTFCAGFVLAGSVKDQGGRAMARTDISGSPSRASAMTRRATSAGLDGRPRLSHVTVADIYERAYREFARRTAVESDEGELTYAALGVRVHRIIGGLR